MAASFAIPRDVQCACWESPATSPQKSTLVVDDNATTRQVLTSQLLHAGYEAAAAASGAVALHCLQRSLDERLPYEVVLADYQLSGMDAATLGQHISRNPLLAQARLIVLTSLASSLPSWRARSSPAAAR